MNRIQKTLSGILLGAMAVSAQAASLSLVYTGSSDIDEDGGIVAQINETVSFDIVMDFTDATVLGGGFDVVFDASILAFDGFTNYEIGDPDLGRDPDVSNGLLESWAFADFNGLSGPDVVGSISFVYLGGGAADILLTATMGIGGPFVSFDDPLTTLDVDFGSATVVPLPAAAWFFLSGLGALVGVRRRDRV